MAVSPKVATEKPRIEEFAQGRPLGEGNFSRIVVATHTSTCEAFALKVIEKQRIKRLRIRHPNIFNEVNMEKETLNRLRHPNIIRLYQTFQDDTNLYFLLELLDGGELLDHLLHENRQLGLDEDLARFYLADVVNAVAYMHVNGVLHRDLKPENMVACRAAGGHLKLIDFGTAKDLRNSTLNGPNFVGTPEYMPPEIIDNKEATYASDSWALGCIVYQLLTGETPFSGGSAYLTFLRTQDGGYHVPEYLSDEAKDLIAQLLQKNPEMRLGGTGVDAMSHVKAHAFFKGIDFENHMTALCPDKQFMGEELLPLVKQLEEAEKARSVSQPLDFTADALQDQIVSLSAHERSLLMHLLRRKQLLHLPGIYPRFFSSPSRGRCLYASGGGYVGFTHSMQNQWDECFSFMQLSGPKLGQAAALTEVDTRGGSTWDAEAAEFRRAIAVLNTKKPAFVVLCGDFVNAKPGQDFYETQVAAFQELLGEISPEVRLIFAAGAGAFETPSALAKYEANFGNAQYSFWFGGIKFIVPNTAMLCYEKEFPQELAAQEEWLRKELENGKLCARGTVVLAGHSLYHVQKASAAADEGAGNNECSASAEEVPDELRKKYWDLICNGQACLVVSGAAAADSVTSIVTKAAEEGADEYKCELVRCQAPWSGSSSAIHLTTVSQDGSSTALCHLESVSSSNSRVADMAAKATATPEAEGQEAILAAELVKLDVAS